MAQQFRPVLNIQVVDLLLDRALVDALPCQQQPERHACHLHLGAGLQHGQDVFLPVHLAHKQDQWIFAQVPPAVDLLHVPRVHGSHGRAVGHHLDLAFIAVFAQHVRRVLSHGPDFVAAVIETHDQLYAHLGNGLRLSGFEKIVIILGMEGRHQRQLSHRGKTERFRAGGEGTVRVDNIQVDHPDPLPVVGVQHRFADFVLFHAGHAAGYIFHQLVRKSTLETRVVHRGDYRHLMSHLAKRL